MKTFQDVFVMQPGELDCRQKLMLGGLVFVILHEKIIS